MLRSKHKGLHLIVKWNPGASFEPDTIPAHAKILLADASRISHVWWGKISKTGHHGMGAEEIGKIQRQIRRGVETHLYMYCPDTAAPSLHVGLLSWAQKGRPQDHEHIPSYYDRLAYRIPFWFKLRDIRLLSREHIDNLELLDGHRFDPVSTNYYPLPVRESQDLGIFDYKATRQKKWCEIQQLDQARFPEPLVNPNLVFVLMPFSREFIDVWELGIRPAIKRVGLDCKRADDFWHAREIMEVIRENIRCARFIIADMSTNNPNVFYELGYAHALGKPVILVTKSRKSVPFDLRGINNIEYSNVAELARKLPKMVRSVLTP